jgi:hypothetical protein
LPLPLSFGCHPSPQAEDLLLPFVRCCCLCLCLCVCLSGCHPRRGSAVAFAFVFAFLVVIPEGDLLLQLPVFLFVIRSAIEITGYPPSMREDLLRDIS